MGQVIARGLPSGEGVPAERDQITWRVHHPGAVWEVPAVGEGKGIANVPLIISPPKELDLDYRALRTLRQEPQTVYVEHNGLCTFALIFLICVALEDVEEGWGGEGGREGKSRKMREQTIPFSPLKVLNPHVRYELDRRKKLQIGCEIQVYI